MCWYMEQCQGWDRLERIGLVRDCGQLFLLFLGRFLLTDKQATHPDSQIAQQSVSLAYGRSFQTRVYCRS